LLCKLLQRTVAFFIVCPRFVILCRHIGPLTKTYQDITHDQLLHEVPVWSEAWNDWTNSEWYTSVNRNSSIHTTPCIHLVEHLL